MGTGVLTPVPALDVDPRYTLLPHARRVDPLHCGGGYIFLDWAPLPGNTAVGKVGVVEGNTSVGGCRAILLRRALHVWDYSEY
jgi:hypothetical protein